MNAYSNSNLKLAHKVELGFAVYAYSDLSSEKRSTGNEFDRNMMNKVR